MTKRRGIVNLILSSCSERPHFDSWPGDGLVLSQVFSVLPYFLKASTSM